MIDMTGTTTLITATIMLSDGATKTVVYGLSDSTQKTLVTLAAIFFAYGVVRLAGNLAVGAKRIFRI